MAEPRFLTVWIDNSRVLPSPMSDADVVDFLLHLRTLQEVGVLQTLSPFEGECDEDVMGLLETPPQLLRGWLIVHRPFANRIWRTRVSATRWR